MEETPNTSHEHTEKTTNTSEENTTSETSQSESLAFNSRIDLGDLQQAVAKIKSELGKVIVGQEQMLEMLIVSILSDGHSLIEGVPGVAKTVTAKLLGLLK